MAPGAAARDCLPHLITGPPAALPANVVGDGQLVVVVVARLLLLQCGCPAGEVRYVIGLPNTRDSAGIPARLAHPLPTRPSARALGFVAPRRGTWRCSTPLAPPVLARLSRTPCPALPSPCRRPTPRPARPSQEIDRVSPGRDGPRATIKARLGIVRAPEDGEREHTFHRGKGLQNQVV